MANYTESDTNTTKSPLNAPKKAETGLTVEQANNICADFKKATEDSGWKSLAEESWRRFQQQDPDSRRRTKQKRYPLWYATGKVRQPLVFSKVPELVVQPILPDKVGFTTELASFAEKFGNTLIEQFPFYNVACSARDDLLLANVGVARVMVDAEFVTEPVKEYVQIQTVPVQGPNGQPVPQEVFVNKAGEQVDPQTVRYSFEGEPYIELPEEREKAKKETVFLKAVPWSDFIWDWEAKEFTEWDFCGFKSQLTKRQVRERFGAEALEKLPKSDEKKDNQPTVGRRKYEIIEFWWKPDKKRYIFAKGAEDFLSVSSDPLKLENFFPIAYPMFDNTTTQDTMPFTEYGAVKGILDHIDDIYDRKAQALRISRPRGLYDSTVQELKIILSNTRSATKDWIGVPNLATKASSGQTFTQHLDTSPVMAALDRYNVEFDAQLKAYDQITRLSDSIRGVTNPFESATATERKAQAVNHGIVNLQQDMQRWCRDSIRLMIDAALEHFSEERIFEMMEPSLTDFQRQKFPEIVQKLKSDAWRIISLDIETDSTVLIDEELDKQTAMELAQVTGGFLQQIANAATNTPEAVPLGAELMNYVITKFRGGKEFQDKIQKQVQAMVQAAQTRQQQAMQPEVPTQIEQFEMQLKGMEHQLKQQTDMGELQLKQRDLERQEFESQVEAQTEQAKAMLEQQRFQFEQVIAGYQVQAEQTQLQINDFKARAQAAESHMEEIRLARDTEIAGIRTMLEAQRPREAQAPQPPMIIQPPEFPPINVNVDSSRPGKRTGKIVYDEMGNARLEVEESLG